MGWADDAQELDDSMLQIIRAGRRHREKRGGERRRRRVFETRGETEIVRGVASGGAQTFEEEPRGRQRGIPMPTKKQQRRRRRRRRRTGLGGGGKTNGGKKDTSSGKNKSGGKKGKRADPSSNYKQSDLPEDERGLHNDVEVRRRQLQKLNVSKSTRAKDLDTLIACVDLAVPGTGEVKRALKDSIFKPLAPAYTTLIKWIGKSNNCRKR